MAAQPWVGLGFSHAHVAREPSLKVRQQSVHTKRSGALCETGGPGAGLPRPGGADSLSRPSEGTVMAVERAEGEAGGRAEGERPLARPGGAWEAWRPSFRVAGSFSFGSMALTSRVL